MEILKPSELQEFLKIFGKYSNSGHCYYRGQSNYSWDIRPGLARNKSIKDYSQIFDVESKLLKRFEQIIEQNKLNNLIEFVEGSYHTSWILLMAAQHHGLPTRLIDFSNNKFRALEFAVADTNNLNNDGAFIIYNDAYLLQEPPESLKLKDPFDNIHKTFFIQAPVFKAASCNEFKLSESRKLIQGSKFLYRDNVNLYKCLSNDNDHSNRLTIIHIPYKLKIDIVEQLTNV